MCLRIDGSRMPADVAAEHSRTSRPLHHARCSAGEVFNASYVDIFSVKAEGNAPILWIRGGSSNVSVLSLGGGLTPFPYNFTFPPDFTPSLASVFRVDADCADVKFANLLDHGYGTSAPYWPPTGYPKACNWEHHYPYPGTAVDVFPFSTYPNATMVSTARARRGASVADRDRSGSIDWHPCLLACRRLVQWNCWFGEQSATAYWYMIVAGSTSTDNGNGIGNGISGQQQSFTTPMDKPILYTT